MSAQPIDRAALPMAGAEEEAAAVEAPALLRVLWADPQYMPEHLALWSLKHFGPRAVTAVESLRGSHPDVDPGELERARALRAAADALMENPACPA